MAEWLKILVSALTGTLVGLLAEPIRKWISDRSTIKTIRSQVYHELGRMYFFLTEHKSLMYAMDKGSVLIILNTDVFEFYYASKRELLYVIPEHHGFISCYAHLKRLRDDLGSDARAVPAVVDDAFENFQIHLIGYELSQRGLDRGMKSYLKARDFELRRSYTAHQSTPSD
jgi:hypothetical protein